MAISDKTRKTLWARSGNRCLLCRIELVQEVEKETNKLIIGEECHIVSEKPNGPRGKDTWHGDFDHYNNLVLLCANDHKRVDELISIYTTEKLKLFKEVHESWVKETLERDVLAFTNDKQNVKSLSKITSGKQLVDLIRDAHMYNFEHEELKTEEEAEKIGGLFEELQDYGDVLSDIGISEVVKYGVKLNMDLDELNKMGFSLFGIRRKMNITNDKSEDIGLYDTTTLLAIRNDNPCIVGDFLVAKFPPKYNVKF